MLSSKRGQIGDTLTWFIATILIVVILFLSILVPSVFWSSTQRKIVSDSGPGTNVLFLKSVYAYLLTEDSSKTSVLNLLKNSPSGVVTGFSKDLGDKLFVPESISPYKPTIYYGIESSGFDVKSFYSQGWAAITGNIQDVDLISLGGNYLKFYIVRYLA